MICESIDKPYVGELVGIFIFLGIYSRDLGVDWIYLAQFVTQWLEF
jgi:hypothetical protein